MQEDKIVKRIPTNLVTKTIITSSAEYEPNKEYTDEDANVYEKYLQAITNVSIGINGDIEKIKTLEDNILEQYNKNVELEKKMEQETELIDLGQLTELPKTFNGINNIWAETNLGNTEIEIEYVQDVKKLLKKQDARLDNIEALLSTTETSALLLDNMQNDLESEVK